MSRMLYVSSSPRGSESQSTQLAEVFLETYRKRFPELKVDTLNLFDDGLPQFGAVAAGAKMAAFSGTEQTTKQTEAWDQVRAVFDRFAAADEYLFTVPMWNAGVPYVLKQWIDLVTQPGWAFGFHPEHGYSGLLTGRKAATVYTSGVYTPGAPLEFGADFHSTFFDDWLRFVGITDVTAIRYQGNALATDPEALLEDVRRAARMTAETF
jgi:FMN-dependent NADH-azoreductase